MRDQALTEETEEDKPTNNTLESIGEQDVRTNETVQLPQPTQKHV